MAAFKTVRAAKDYLAGLIAEQAEREGPPLTDVERRMLYFTQSEGRLPEMASLNAEFERDYCEPEYEGRIGRLVHAIYLRENSSSEIGRDSWNQAVGMLTEEEDYLLVLIDAAEMQAEVGGSADDRRNPWVPVHDIQGPRAPGDFRRLALVGIGLFAVMVVAIALLAVFH